MVRQQEVLDEDRKGAMTYVDAQYFWRKLI